MDILLLVAFIGVGCGGLQGVDGLFVNALLVSGCFFLVV